MSESYQEFLNRAAQAYGYDPAVLKYVNKYENGGKSTFDYNNWDSNAKKGTPSAGPFQFIEPTFNAYAKSAKAANPAAWKNIPVAWNDPRAQALAAAWAMKNGKGSAWTTYKRAVKSAGGERTSDAVAAPVSAASSSATPASSNQTQLLEFIFKGSPFAGMATERAQREPLEPTTHNHEQDHATPTGKIGKDYRWLQQQGQKLFGLRNDAGDSQTTGGKHADGSEHYGGRAIDFGNAKNSAKQLAAWKAWAKKQGLDVLDEHDHIHVSLPGSGI